MEQTNIINALLDPKVGFFIVAKSKLKELLAQNQHPAIVPLPKQYKTVLLEGNGLRVSNQSILAYYQETLDKNQRFLFDHCDIQVEGDFGVRFANLLKR